VDGLPCNIGYARGVCPQFPSDAPHDAVRFHRLADKSLLYVFERDHTPTEHGQVNESSGRLKAQATAFAKGLPVCRAGGGTLSGIDLNDSASLLDNMENQSDSN
jgi:hypothetical protein